RDVLSESRQIALEHLAARPLVDQTALDPAKCLRDRLVFLLEALQAAVDLVEVSEDFGAELVEPPIQRVEPLVHRVEPPVHGCESLVDDGKALVDGLEALIDGVEALIDARKALAEESDELRILGRRHARSLPHPREAIKCINSWTIAS